MSLKLKFLFAAYAMLIVACTQVFGVSNGYICVCTGEQVIVTADHCHDHHDHSHDFEHESPLEHESHSTKHAPNKLDVELNTLTKIPAPPVPVVAELPEFLTPVLLVRESPAEIAVHLWKLNDNEPPPPPLAEIVSECMVLLV